VTTMKTPEDLTMAALSEEVKRARTKFPGNRFLLAALTEEVGELAQALLQKAPKGEIQNKCLQVACVAIRILEEGDASFADITDAESKP
jgi:NTP pyrophosphatase (non-canonical NTP hydrolase)